MDNRELVEIEDDDWAPTVPITPDTPACGCASVEVNHRSGTLPKATPALDTAELEVTDVKSEVCKEDEVGIFFSNWRKRRRGITLEDGNGCTSSQPL